MNDKRRISRRGIFSTAGWLFADLLLALTIIFIAASAIGKPPRVIRSHTLTPTPTPVRILQTLDPHPLTFTVNVDPLQLGSSDTVSYVKDQVSQQLNHSHNGRRKVGFVITLAGGVAGVDNATSFNSILKSMPSFQGAVFKNYHDLGNPDNEFDLEIYFFIKLQL